MTITVTNFNALTVPPPRCDADQLHRHVSGPIVTQQRFPSVQLWRYGRHRSAGAGGPAYTAFTLTGGASPAFPAGAGSTTCTITAPVTATATGTNTLPANNFGGVVIAAASGTLSVSAITGSKAFSTPALQTGTTTMTVTLTNLTATLANITSFTDNLLTTMGAGFHRRRRPVIRLPLRATITSRVWRTTITERRGRSRQRLLHDHLPVTIAAIAATGNRTNTIAVNGVKTDQGNNKVTITGTVNVQRALTVTKAFVPAMSRAARYRG